MSAHLRWFVFACSPAWLVAAGWMLAGAAAEMPRVSSLPSDADPWALLAEIRDRLRSQSPLEARFKQSFVPSGFSDGDSESGALYVDLPRCLRFEYLEPFPKNFLLCGDWVYTWNPDEPSGRRFLTGEGDAEGLDLLRLDVDSLRARYSAAFGRRAAGDMVIELVSIDPSAEIRSASLELAPRSGSTGSAPPGLRALSYDDQSGNRTRFEISAYRSLADRTAFQPPELEWLED